MALLLALVLWPISRGGLLVLQGVKDESAAAATVQRRYHTEGGVLVETRRLEAVQCRYVYRAGPKKGHRCGHVTTALDGYCPNHRTLR